MLNSRLLWTWVLFSSTVLLIIQIWPPSASAQSKPSGVEGNWQVDWIGSTYEETPESVRISLHRERGRACDDEEMSGCVFKDLIAPDGEWEIEIYDGEKEIAVQSLSVDPAMGTIDIHHYYHIFDLWGGKESAQLAGEDAVRGKWVGNDEEGETVWQRIAPTYSGLAARNVGDWKHLSHFEARGAQRIEVIMPWARRHWSDKQNFPGQRPHFELQVFGDNLWGRHFASVPKSQGFNISSTRRGTSSEDEPAFLIVEITLWPGARPGLHTLYLDGAPIEIDLKVPGFPEEPENIAIEGLTFTGLARHSVPITDPLIFTGFKAPNTVNTSGLSFTGYADPNRITLDDPLIFAGWHAEPEPLATDRLVFDGWSSPETLKADTVGFEGWRYDGEILTTDRIVFAGQGRD